jgi:hypothetical protein
MTPAFIAAVLEGFEGTLDAVLERVGEDELRREIESLQGHIAGKRRKFEEQAGASWPATFFEKEQNV